MSLVRFSKVPGVLGEGSGTGWITAGWFSGGDQCGTEVVLLCSRTFLGFFTFSGSLSLFGLFSQKKCFWYKMERKQ